MRLRAVAATLALVTLVSCSPRGSSGTATPSPFPIATGDYPMAGHAADFSWIAGTLVRDLSCTYLVFGERRSLWGGHIALSVSSDELGELHSGDTVIVKGELIKLAYGSCGSPSYRVDSIEEH